MAETHIERIVRALTFCPFCRRTLSAAEYRLTIRAGHCGACGPGPEVTDDPERNDDGA